MSPALADGLFTPNHQKILFFSFLKTFRKFQASFK